MEAKAKKFLQTLLTTPSPSGYEQKIQEVVREYVKPFADEVTTDVHGNVIVGKNVDAPLRILLAGHCDQIGLIVTHISDKGFIHFINIGGWDAQQLVGQRMSIWTESGEVLAVISRKASHLLTPEERKKAVKLDDLWLDIGAKDKAEAAELVMIGDPVTLHLPGYQEMRNGLANSPGMDDKTGVWVVIEALRRAAKKSPNVAIFAVSTVQEEVGLRGARTSAFGVDPHVGIAVDVTHATDCPTIDKKRNGDVALGGGPVLDRGPNTNPRLFSMLYETAKREEISVQLSAHGRPPGTDANAIQLVRDGIATEIVSVPNRYMHSAVEMISFDDIDNCADLLAAFMLSLSGDEDFTP